MNKLKLLLVAAAAVVVSCGAFAAEKYALVVGVGKYANDRQDELPGCAADVRNMVDVLTQYGGWSADSMVVLQDEKATRTNVRAAFRDLAGRVRSGDTLVVYWSAHGGYAYNPKEEVEESADVCAYDADYSDAMMAQDLENLPSGVKVVVVLDTCCSGAFPQLVKVGGDAKAASATFAQRVDALLAHSKAGGLAASEIGWLTAVAYNQNSSDVDSTVGGRYTGSCLVYDGIRWGKADTDKDGDISFLDLHIHARKWFSEDAMLAREEAICGQLSAAKRDEIKKKATTVSPQMLNGDVLASVLVRDHEVAGGNKYPFKVEFHIVCENTEVPLAVTSNSAPTIQFVWPGESAVEPTFDFDPESYYLGNWDKSFENVREDLIVLAQCVKVSDPDAKTFEAVAEKVKRFMGFALVACEDAETNKYQYVGATFEGVYAKGGNLTVTLTEFDGTKTKFKGSLEEVPINGRYWAELTSPKCNDTLEIWMDASSVIGTFYQGDFAFPVLGNWDWLSTHDTSAQAVCKNFGAVYNVGMDVNFVSDGREELPSAGGYLNVKVSEKDGKANVVGMLADGTKISVLTRAVLLTTPETALSEVSQGICVPILLPRTNKRSGFSGLLNMRFDANGGLRASLTNELRFVGTSYGIPVASWDEPALGGETECQAYLTGDGSEFVADEMPETATTEMSGDVPPLYVKVGGQTVVLDCNTNSLPNDYELEYANGKFKVTDPEEDKAKLKLTVNKRTGVVSGSFRVWYADDPDEPTVEKSVTATVYGGWESLDKKARAFALVTDTNPAQAKRKVPLALTIVGADEAPDPED